ncbi:uncharacterized protein LOC126972974 isoform X1 [Leptidea sinapis]|uniref:uncharacterized protein LOC126972974 isoform X1 n=1 Tax=Leptidea sinapis TaxID=189913 RepID=UPI0021C46A0A|nr:uncharacterized protein LOC126972974 isoform X1 [Leptidea sinapis]
MVHYLSIVQSNPSKSDSTRIFQVTVGVNCQCDTYYACLSSFVENFFKNSSYFLPTNIESKNQNSELDFNTDDINKIISGVSGFLRDEVNGTVNLDSDFSSFRSNDKSTIVVKSFIIGNPINELQDDFDYYENDSENIENLTEKDLTNKIIQPQKENLTNIFINKTVIEYIIPLNEDNSGFVKDIPKSVFDNEILIEYYDEDNATDYPIIDYVDIYKDTTNEYNEYKTTEISTTDSDLSHVSNLIIMNKTTSYDNSTCHRNKDVADVFSWIAAIFVKNTTDQFEYRCDGALLSSTVVITAARCVESTRAEDVIIILGKTSLNITKDTEKIVRVNNIIVHENFTASDDDIASLQIDAADETETISVSCLGDELDYDKAMTTGWAVSGDLTPIYFNKKKSESCQMSRKICGAYGNDVVVCPSYGGIFATERNKTWHLLGIRSTISSRGNFCVHEPVYYTRLCDYAEWLVDLI